jgi:tetratricopeptide (TPR) repeat protein
MGRTAIAYQQRQISEAAAVTVLDNWQTLPTVEFPPELFLLAAALPAAPEREALYDALLELEPDNVGINRRWVQLWALRDPDKAQARVNQLLTDYPDQPEIYFVQGELAQALGDLDLASQSYQAILAQQPDQLDALAALAGIRFQQQRYAEAETLYQQVLAQRPGDPEIRRVLVELDLAQDRPVAAWQQLSQLRQEQAQAGVQDPQIDDRAQQLQIDFLKRRGFQPRWERY